MEAGALCRAVESYLRRKNDGHLIRIAGPAFEMVRGWAAAGIPLRVVERGIDRRYDRYYARGPKRHPLRIEFCEADVLDLFDEWKRAVGVGASAGFGGGETETGAAGDEARAAGDEAGAAGDEAGAAGAAGDEAAPRRTRPEGRGSISKHLDALAARLSAWEPPPGAAALDVTGQLSSLVIKYPDHYRWRTVQYYYVLKLVCKFVYQVTLCDSGIISSLFFFFLFNNILSICC